MAAKKAKKKSKRPVKRAAARDQTLQQERKTDKDLTALAESAVNTEAMATAA
ncbi:MAG: hypothetical protein HY242_00555 [Afipia sp.]|nr:hypothetical protein [Afipia sp.]